MGKMLETFRHPGAARACRPDLDSDSTPDVPEEDAPQEEIPFIEVGPKHSFEASPAVLAAIPGPRPQPALSPKIAPAAEPALSRPHHVLFRSLKAPTKFAADLVAFHAPDQPASSCYVELLESIRAAVGATKGAEPAALLFTAARPKVGTTTVLLNVAITAARKGCRVAVVDANLRRPAVAERLGLEPAPGLTEVLGEEVSLESALRSTEQDNLAALTAGSPAPTLASIEALRALLAELRRDFDVIFVDGPAWDGRSTVTALAGACDSVFLVAGRDESETAPGSDLPRQLPRQGVRLAGCILTGA